MPFTPIARFYDADDGQIDEDVPAVLALARRAGGPVLELGAGTGRLMLPLAQAGYAVTGVELVPAMLEQARTRLERAGLANKARFVVSDFRDFDLPDRFALAYCGYNSFLHLLEVSDQLQALRCWRRCLRADGLLAIDVHNPHLDLLTAADGSLALADHWPDPTTGRAVYKLQAADVDLADQVFTLHRFYDEVGDDGVVRRSVAHLVTRLLFRREFETLLPLAGYDDLHFYGDFDLSAWQPESPRILVTARPRH